MLVNYCNEAQVAAALGTNPTSTLTAAVNAGTNTLTVQSGTWYPGQKIAVDYFQDDTVAEVALIQSVSGSTLTLTANLVNNHVQGAPVAEVSAISKVVGPASRMVDSITYYEEIGFNQETVTETLTGYVQTDGSVFIPARKPVVQSVTSISLNNSALDTPAAVASGNWDIDGYNVTAYTINTSFLPVGRQCKVIMTYVGGFNPVPVAIARAAVVFAARFFKEKDSGFSDMIGNSDLGIMQYKKGIPAEVAVLLKPYIRVTP